VEDRPTAAPVLVGRDGELGELLAGLDDAMSGRGGCSCLPETQGLGRAAWRMRRRLAPATVGSRWSGGGAGRPAGHRMFIRYLSPADIERIVGLWAHIREGRAAEVALGAGPRDDDRAVSLQTDLHD